MASDAMMQAIGRLERALTRAEGLARQFAEDHARLLLGDERPGRGAGVDGGGGRRVAGADVLGQSAPNDVREG